MVQEEYIGLVKYFVMFVDFLIFSLFKTIISHQP